MLLGAEELAAGEDGDKHTKKKRTFTILVTVMRVPFSRRCPGDNIIFTKYVQDEVNVLVNQRLYGFWFMSFVCASSVPAG